MEQKRYALNDRSKEYFSKTKENIIRSHNNWLSTIHTYSYEENLMSLTMDNTQMIHSISISEKLFSKYNEREISERLHRFLNDAIIQAGKNAVKEMQNSISPEELNNILSQEDAEVKKNYELLMKKNNQTIQELVSINRTINSPNGNISLVILGNRIIRSVEISKRIFTEDSRNNFEKELMETVNKALQEVIEEIQGLFNKNEEEFNQNIIQEY
jgi:DNA-binding protein YbaB